MARVLLGPIVSDLRGKLGGSVFQRSAQGTTLRSRVTPVNPRTPVQATNKAMMYQLQILWQELTAEQRTLWATWSQYMNLTTGQFTKAGVTGQQAFIQANRYRLLIGQAIVEDPVFTPYTLDFPVFSVAVAGSEFVMTFTGMTDETLYRPIVSLSAPISVSRNARPNGVRLMRTFTNIDAENWNITNAYTEAFGANPLDTDKLWAEWGMIQLSNSALSVFSKTTLIVG